MAEYSKYGKYIKHAEYAELIYNELAKAINTNNVKEIEDMIDKGIDLNAKYSGQGMWGDSVLGLAVGYEDRYSGQYGRRTDHVNDEMIEILLLGGADPNTIDDRNKYQVLINAFDTGRINVVKMLLQFGANVNININNGQKLLCYAIGHLVPKIEMIKLLIEAGSILPDNIENFRNSEVKNYLKSIKTSAKQRRIGFFNNLTRDISI